MPRVADALLTILLAPTCAACDAPLDHPSRGPVCNGCWQAIPFLTTPICQWRHPHQIARAGAIGEYEGSLRAIVHALKYDGRRSLGRPLAALLVQRAGNVLHDAGVAVPVPLHPSRQRERGFNQASEIARHLPLPTSDALRRIRATATQIDLPAAQRHANVRDAFAMRRHRDVAGRIVVLVDDVSTTGATLDACARVLLAAGAREVRAVTAARVVARSR